MADKHIYDLPGAGALTGAELVPVDQGGATVQTTVGAIAAMAPTQDHNLLTNLTAGDPHTQYLNDVRGDLRYPPLARLISAGNGLSGGGNLTADRTLTVVATAARGITVTVNGVELDLLGIGQLPEAVDGTNDKVPIYNQSEGRPRYVSPSVLLAGASGFVTTARSIISGAGLTGGGDLTVDRTLAVGAGTGILVNADDVALDTTHPRNTDHGAVNINTTTGLTGGGNLTASRTLSLDTTHTRNVDHSAVAISAGTGLSGGGDLTATRTLSINTAVVPQLAAQNVFTAQNNFLTVVARSTVSGPNGYVGLVSGDPTHTGYTAWYLANDTRVGYMGFGTANTLVLVGEAGYSFDLFTNSGATVPWAKITGTKNADQLGGLAPSSYVQVNTAPQLSALGVGTSAGAAGSIRATGDITAGFSSDIRWKENIQVITNALAKLHKIRGVEFDWNADYQKVQGWQGNDPYFEQVQDVGVIAQEVKSAQPRAVRTRPDGSLAVIYDRLVPLLVEAVKELSAEVEMLKAKLS